MRLISSENNQHELKKRLISEDGRIEMGIYPVIYGFRLRAGFSENGFSEIDWCCGNQDQHINFLYNALKEYLESYEGTDNPFKDLPLVSKIKPYFKDDDFMSVIKDVLLDR